MTLLTLGVERGASGADRIDIAHVKNNRLIDFLPVLSNLAEAIGKVKPGDVIHIEPRSQGKR